MSHEELIEKNNTGKLTPAEIKTLVELEIPIIPEKHCIRTQLARQRLRYIMEDKLMKKHGYK